MTRNISNTYLSSKKDESLGLANYDLSSELSQDKLGSYNNSHSNNELNNNPKSDKDNRKSICTR